MQPLYFDIRTLVFVIRTNSPKSPCNFMEPLYFDIRTPVFVMRTYIVRILNSSMLSEVRILNLSMLSEVRISNLGMLSEVCISNFEYVYRVMRSEKLVRKLKVRIWRSTEIESTYMEKYVN